MSAVYPYVCGSCGGAEAVPISISGMTAHWRSHVEGVK